MEENSTRVQILSVSPHDADHLALSRMLGHTAWACENACTLSDAMEALHSGRFHVVLCDRDLPDGDWKAMLDVVQDSPDSPLLIVTARDADDRLWAEVLNLGAYDVLVKPFQSKEVFRTVGLAWRHWSATRRTRRMPLPKVNASETREHAVAASSPR
jgi:DNA-binding response OmpR family regulator